MKFAEDVADSQKESVEAAFAAISEKGNDEHRRVTSTLLDSELLIRVRPVSEINASGVAGVISPWRTKGRIDNGPMSVREALGEVFICMAAETLNGQRGTEGTLVHEGRHAYDFAHMIASLSDAEVNPLSVFDPTLYELEYAAHKTSGEYMLCINREDYINEGLDLMILGRDSAGTCFVSVDGIKLRLKNNYGLSLEGDQGRLVSEVVGIL
jgi:hypothetical protein